MRVKHVEAMNELENGDDEWESKLRGLGEDAVMLTVHQLARRAGIEAIEVQLVVFNDLTQRANQLEEIGTASLRLPVEVVGVDADAHPEPGVSC